MYFLNLSRSVGTETHHILENEINIRQEEKDYINKEENLLYPTLSVKKVNQIHIFKPCYPLIFCFIVIESAEFYRV